MTILLFEDSLFDMAMVLTSIFNSMYPRFARLICGEASTNSAITKDEKCIIHWLCAKLF